MKKIYSGLFVAALAILSACQPKTAEIVSPIRDGQTLFTASLGPDTKIYMEYDADRQVYKNLWEADDRIYIMAYDDNNAVVGRRYAQLVDGAGTSRATFASSVDGGVRYMAFYGPGHQDEDYTIYPYILTRQVMREDVESYAYQSFPMYAVSGDHNFEFKNLASVLKIEVSGNTYLESINISSNSEDVAMSGNYSVSFDDNGIPHTEILESTACQYIAYEVNRNLSVTEPLNCYIVVPAQTCTGGITVSFAGPEGTMVKEYTQDITFERSQIRTIRNVVFSVENPNSWGMIGSFSDWATDIVMERTENGYLSPEIYLTTEDEFKFRANGMWNESFGGDGQVLYPGTTAGLVRDGFNLKVSQEGYYTFLLDPVNALVTANLVRPVVTCSNWDEISAVDDGTLVRARGFVFGSHQRGFILNVGNEYRNGVLVFTYSQPIEYTPVLGNIIEIVAEKTTYNGIPELQYVQSCTIIDATEADYGYGSYYNLSNNPTLFDNIQIDRSDYVVFIGTLEQNGNYWNVKVDGATRVGSINYPLEDLTPYVGKRIYVGGWYCGISGNGKYFNVMMREIIPENTAGDLEDIVPGGDIVELPEI